MFTPPAAPFEHWQRVSAAIGIARGVTVSPAIHGTNNDATLDAIERSEGAVRGMIRANAALTAQDIAALHRRGVRGMRFTFVPTHGGRSVPTCKNCKRTSRALSRAAGSWPFSSTAT